VLTNGIAIARHVDAGYELARKMAKEKGVKILIECVMARSEKSKYTGTKRMELAKENSKSNVIWIKLS
jgi:hypothetical protein